MKTYLKLRSNKVKKIIEATTNPAINPDKEEAKTLPRRHLNLLCSLETKSLANSFWISIILDYYRAEPENGSVVYMPYYYQYSKLSNICHRDGKNNEKGGSW
jgi:hypothetical protein